MCDSGDLHGGQRPPASKMIRPFRVERENGRIRSISAQSPPSGYSPPRTEVRDREWTRAARSMGGFALLSTVDALEFDSNTYLSRVVKSETFSMPLKASDSLPSCMPRILRPAMVHEVSGVPPSAQESIHMSYAVDSSD